MLQMLPNPARTVLTAALVLLLAGCGFTGLKPGSGSASGTRVVTVTGAGHFNVTATVSGHCWTTSIASNRKDAFRCMVGNAIYDPCFIRDRQAVLCPTDLPSGTATLIKLTAPLPATLPGSAAPAQGSVWQMKLAAGNLCGFITGTGVSGYPFGCTGKLWCAAPTGPVAGWYRAQCGPLAATSTMPTVTDAKAYPVAVLWR